MALRLETMQPTASGFPLGIMVAADFIPEDDRRGIYMEDAEGHRLIVGPPGSGKFTSAIAPLLLTADAHSAIIFDVANGEAAIKTSGHRASLGPVAVLDPFGMTGAAGSAFNPLDLLRADDPAILSKARRLADALMMFSKGGGDADYWNGQASNFMVALLIHVATSPDEEGRRTLQRVREIVRRPFSIDRDDAAGFRAALVEGDWQEAERIWPNGLLLDAMKENLIAGGIVRDEAENITAAEGGKNAFYIQQTMRENTAFLDLPEVQRVTAATDFDIASLRRGVATLYIVVPEYELHNVNRWLRLLYASIMEQMRQIGDAATATRLHVILDEFPAFGRFDRVKADMALVRKWGNNMHVVVQSLEQLDRIYGRGWQEILGVSMYRQLLGANDLATARFFSDSIGKTTVAATSQTHSRASAGGSQSTSQSWQSEPLLSVDQIMQMDRDLTVVLVEGKRPLKLHKWHYYQDSYLSGRADKLPTWKLAKSA